MGDLVVWGWGDMGVRGKGATNDPRLVLRGQQAVRSACGFYHTLTLTDAGQLYSYGWGAYGQLGHGNEKDQKDKAEDRLTEGACPGSHYYCPYAHSHQLRRCS